MCLSYFLCLGHQTPLHPSSICFRQVTLISDLIIDFITYELSIMISMMTKIYKYFAHHMMSMGPVQQCTYYVNHSEVFVTYPRVWICNDVSVPRMCISLLLPAGSSSSDINIRDLSVCVCSGYNFKSLK